MILLGSFPVTTPSYVLNVLAGLYESFVIVTSGTNKSGQTATAKQVGNFILRRNGREFANVNLGYLANYNNAEGGFPVFSSSTGAAFYQSVHWNAKCYSDNTDNAMSLAPNEAQIQIDLGSSVSTLFESSTTVTIYGVESLVTERYRRQLSPFSQPLTANSQTTAENSQPNIVSVYFDDADDYAQIQIEQNGKSKVQVPGLVLRDETAYKARIESSVTFAIANLAKGWENGNLGAVISNRFRLLATGASSVTTSPSVILVESLSFNESSAADSVATVTSQNLQAAQTSPTAANVTTTVTTPPVRNPAFSLASLNAVD